MLKPNGVHYAYAEYSFLLAIIFKDTNFVRARTCSSVGGADVLQFRVHLAHVRNAKLRMRQHAQTRVLYINNDLRIVSHVCLFVMCARA